MRSPVRYYGGKFKLASLISGLIPEHEVYIEPCCGGLNVLFAKDQSPVEVANDRDTNVCDFWNVVKDPADCQALVELLQATPNSKEHYERCRLLFPTCTDRLERARQYFVLAQQSYNGAFGKGWSLRHGQATGRRSPTGSAACCPPPTGSGA